MRGYCDGACRGGNPGQCSCAFAVDIDGHWYEHSRYLGPEKHTNNYAEYQGLLDLLKWAESEKVFGLEIFCDSELVINQVTGKWGVHREELVNLCGLAVALKVRGNHTITWVRGHNGDAGNELVDKLCNECLDKSLAELKVEPDTVEDKASAAYHERTGKQWYWLNNTQRRKEIERYIEEHESIT